MTDTSRALPRAAALTGKRGQVRVHIEMFAAEPVLMARPATSVCTTHFTVAMHRDDLIHMEEIFAEYWELQQRLLATYREIAEEREPK